MKINMTELKCRLNNLYLDLRCSNETIVRQLVLYSMTRKDRERVLRELYDMDFLPYKTTNPEVGIYRKVKVDPKVDAERFEKYLTGFDEYLRRQEKQIDTMIYNNRVAVELFRYIITLEVPYCDVLYLSYFKKLSVDEVCKILYLSRPSYFRAKKQALKKLLDMYNTNDK